MEQLKLMRGSCLRAVMRKSPCFGVKRFGELWGLGFRVFIQQLQFMRTAGSDSHKTKGVWACYYRGLS